MGLVTNLALVFVAGLVTALATGLGALPFVFLEEVSDRLQVALWGLASGIVVSAPTFGLVLEGLAEADGPGDYLPMGVGLLAGVVLVADLPGRGYRELAGGHAVGVAVMVPLAFLGG